MFFFPIAIVVKLLYSWPVVTETRVGEARSGKKHKRPHFYPFEGVNSAHSQYLCQASAREQRSVDVLIFTFNQVTTLCCILVHRTQDVHMYISEDICMASSKACLYFCWVFSIHSLAVAYIA